MYIIHILYIYIYNFIKGKPHSTNTYLIKIDPITDRAVLALKAGRRVGCKFYSRSHRPFPCPGPPSERPPAPLLKAQVPTPYARPGPKCGLLPKSGRVFPVAGLPQLDKGSLPRHPRTNFLRLMK